MSDWKKILAFGCSHGVLQSPIIVPQILDFAKRWEPEIRVHLGDVVDTAAYRHGAQGTPDEREDPEEDVNIAAKMLREFDPTHLTLGNHDDRLHQMMHSTSAIVAHSARVIWDQLKDALSTQCVITPYDIRKNWIQLGGHYWGHGFMFNINALRDHAEMCGGPVVMAHIHTPQAVRARTFDQNMSFCVGTAADIDRMGYARRRRQTLTWGHGFVYGHVREGESRLWLVQSAPGQPLPIPAI